jgi:hypothetical protein
MAFGIDDVLSAAAAGINLTDQVVRIVKAYSKEKKPLDIELLIEEVRITALRRIDEADFALVQLERTLIERDVNLEKSLQEIIQETSFWKPFETFRLNRIRNAFNMLSDAAYNAVDDVASLVRCLDQTEDMGEEVATSAHFKHDFNQRLISSSSIRNSISLLRAELVRQKSSLMS